MKIKLQLRAVVLAVAVHSALACGAAELPQRTALDAYIAQPDDSYSWRIVASRKAGDIDTLIVDLISQHWLTAEDVDRAEWRHWLTLSIPKAAASATGLLFIGGGSNGGERPDGADERMTAIAKATGSVVAELRMVPNQPLAFHGDGKPRVEDDLIGYAWDRFLQTGESRWLPRNAMVKSAVRAMDTITAVMATEAGGKRTVDRFVVAGGSKRGWTAWLTGAVDSRVVGIVPIVIDVLNVDVSMRHQFAAYGFWAPAVSNYVEHGIMRRLGHRRLAELYRLVDPHHYRHRLTLPKLVLNAAGDQFFLPDSSRFYWRDLRGENYLRYVPNADHGLGGSDAAETIAAFHTLIAQGRKPPQFSWLRGTDGSLQVLAADLPQEVRLWQATNPEARDFRMETLGPKYASSVVEPDAAGRYAVRVPAPQTGWTAWFLELAYDVGAVTPLKLTTEVVVTPDTLPFQDKPTNLPTSVTLFCTIASASRAQKIASEAERLAQGETFATDGIAATILGKRLYLNWTPAAGFAESATLVYGFLKERNCADIGYQLESGPGATLPPTTAKRPVDR